MAILREAVLVDRIKGVKRASVLRCKDAITKEAVDAVLSGSSDASYRQINIHSVKAAGTLKQPAKNALQNKKAPQQFCIAARLFV